MRHVAMLGCVLLGACSADPWPGRYEGTRVADARECDGTMLPAETDTSVDVTIERGSVGLFLRGDCLFQLEELSATTARVEPSGCDVTTTDGTPLHVELVNGTATLDGDELTLRMAIDTTSPDPRYCLTITSEFIGSRR